VSSNKFTQLTISDTLTESLIEKVNRSTSDQWKDVLEMHLLPLKIDDFAGQPEIIDFIEQFECEGHLAIYEFQPNYCYSWHIDSSRHCAVNMLLTGFDSFAMFGDMKSMRKIYNIERLEYQRNKYYLFDVSKMHCVVNFSEKRYLLSIGAEKPNRYEQALEYFAEKRLIG
jgi:hypothetical protein